MLCVICAGMVLLCCSCAAAPTAVDTTIPRSVIETDWVGGISYSWDSLSAASTYIVEADVVAVDDSTAYGLATLAIAKLSVRESLKGDLTGDVLVQDTGLLEGDGERTLSGAPLMREGHRVLLFLEETDMVTADGEAVYRLISGLPLAKFFYDEDGRYHNALSYSKDVSEVTPMFGDQQPRTLREIKKLI